MIRRQHSPNKLFHSPLSIAVFMGLIFHIATAAAAADTGKSASGGFVVGKWAFSRLNKVHELINQKKYNAAIEILDTMRNKKRINDHERALMWQTYGFVWSSKGKLPQAIRSFEKCLALNALAEGAVVDMKFNLGQLYMATRQYPKAVQELTEWINLVKNPTPQSQYLLAMAHSQNKGYDKALHYAKKALASSKKDDESLMQFILSLHFQLKQHYEVARDLEQLVAKFPKKTYWLQLAAIYGELKRHKEMLAVLELSYQQGFLTKASELFNLASLYLHHGVPIKGAKVLQDNLAAGRIKRDERSLQMLAEAYLYARDFERAVEPLRQAAQLAEKGDLYLRLGQIFLKKEKWQKAIATFNAGIKKGKLTDPGTAYLMLGIANSHLERKKAAQFAFQKALQHEKTKTAAKQWLKILAAK